jgi:hypothetical protein
MSSHALSNGETLIVLACFASLMKVGDRYGNETLSRLYRRYHRQAILVPLSSCPQPLFSTAYRYRARTLILMESK